MKNNGHLHPLTQYMRSSMAYFDKLGFKIIEGNEIESEWFNFDALNVPAHHPARDAQDTFWIDSKEPKALRVHTTASESHIVSEKKLKPPFRIITPGRVYRNERTDVSHDHTFYQFDGIVVEKDVNITHLISILSGWIKSTLGEDVKIRIRPSFFPFVRPGIEIDYQLSDGKWREALGAGVAHPTVLENMGIDSTKWQGIMWGPGIDRFAMLKYKIDDVRRFHSQDLRFLKQF